MCDKWHISVMAERSNYDRFIMEMVWSPLVSRHGWVCELCMRKCSDNNEKRQTHTHSKCDIKDSNFSIISFLIVLILSPCFSLYPKKKIYLLKSVSNEPNQNKTLYLWVSTRFHVEKLYVSTLTRNTINHNTQHTHTLSPERYEIFSYTN